MTDATVHAAPTAFKPGKRCSRRQLKLTAIRWAERRASLFGDLGGVIQPDQQQASRELDAALAALDEVRS